MISIIRLLYILWKITLFKAQINLLPIRKTIKISLHDNLKFQNARKYKYKRSAARVLQG